jgi:hypothetical protein
MIEIKDESEGWQKTSHLLFHDEGLSRPKGKTKVFTVYSSQSKSLLGYIKWYGAWRSYCFFPLNSLFDSNCLIEVAVFCDEKTNLHMERRPKINHARNLGKSRRARRIEQLANKKEELEKKRLTIKVQNDKIDLTIEKESSGSEVPELVEDESLYDFS